MQLFEMQGLLAGKCLPGDMLVGESLAKYLLRHINQRDELARQASALQTSQDNIINGLGIKGDGPYSKLVLEKFIALQAKCDALAAENVALRKSHPQPFGPEMMKAIDAFDACAESVPEQGMLNAFFILRDSIQLTTERTDAAIAEIKAQGLDELAEAWEAIKPEDGVSMSASTFHKYQGRALDVRDFAANLRAGRKG